MPRFTEDQEAFATGLDDARSGRLLDSSRLLHAPDVIRRAIYRAGYHLARQGGRNVYFPHYLGNFGNYSAWLVDDAAVLSGYKPVYHLTPVGYSPMRETTAGYFDLRAALKLKGIW